MCRLRFRGPYLRSRHRTKRWFSRLTIWSRKLSVRHLLGCPLCSMRAICLRVRLDLFTRGPSVWPMDLERSDTRKWKLRSFSYRHKWGRRKVPLYFLGERSAAFKIRLSGEAARSHKLLSRGLALMWELLLAWLIPELFQNRRWFSINRNLVASGVQWVAGSDRIPGLFLTSGIKPFRT